MTNAEKIRVSLQLLQPGEELNVAHLKEVTGIKNLAGNIAYMVKTTEVLCRDSGGTLWYRLNPAYKSKRKTGIDRVLPVKRKPKKKKTAVKPRKAAKKKRTGKLAAVPAASGANRWALTSDGAFVLLGTTIEIPRGAARPLIEFVRALDQGAA